MEKDATIFDSIKQYVTEVVKSKEPLEGDLSAVAAQAKGQGNRVRGGTEMAATQSTDQRSVLVLLSNITLSRLVH